MEADPQHQYTLSTAEEHANEDARSKAVRCTLCWAAQRCRERGCIQTPPLNRIAGARSLSKSQETIDSARAVHSHDTLEALLVESDLPVRF